MGCWIWHGTKLSQCLFWLLKTPKNHSGSCRERLFLLFLVSQNRLLKWKITECRENSHMCVLQEVWKWTWIHFFYFQSLRQRRKRRFSLWQQISICHVPVQGPAHRWDFIDVHCMAGTWSRVGKWLASPGCEVEPMIQWAWGRLPTCLPHRQMLHTWHEGNSFLAVFSSSNFGGLHVPQGSHHDANSDSLSLGWALRFHPSEEFPGDA